jgi:CRP-like cAMP-binding protein
MISIMPDSFSALFGRFPGHEIAFGAGEVVFRLDDPVTRLHLVRQGRIQLVRHSERGASLVLQRAASGSVLAEASLYSANYHCDAVAETDAETWAVSKSDLRAQLEGDTNLAVAWAQHLAHEVQRSRLHTQILSLRTVAQRLDAWLAWHGSLPLKGEWALVAEEIAVSPEALYRELAKRRP